MIVYWFLDLLSSIVSGLLGLIPDVPVPGWMSDTSGLLSSLLGYASSMSVWFPWTVAAVVVPTVLACVAVGFATKVTRIVASFLTAGGGSAG